MAEPIKPVTIRRTAALLILLSVWSPALAGDLSGQASIIDGDTLEIHGTRIRLWGIDAPESSQLCRDEDSSLYRCGAQAANDLDAFIARRPVSCLFVGLDQYGRTVATCLAGGADLGEWLVRNGLALDWPQFSKGRYAAAQHDAEHVGRGIWKGSYVEPWLRRGDVGGLAQPLQRSELRQVVDHLFRLANEEQLRCRRSRSDRIDGDVAATEFFGEHCVMASTAAFVAA